MRLPLENERSTTHARCVGVLAQATSMRCPRVFRRECNVELARASEGYEVCRWLQGQL
jgi:hypothetical protein